MLFLKKNKFLILIVLILCLYLNSEKETTDNLEKINHPEERIAVTDKYTLLKYKPDFEYLVKIPVYAVSKENGRKITLRYLGFIDGLEYIYDDKSKLDISSKDESLYFQAYIEVETDKKIDDGMINFYGKIRGTNKKVNLNKNATTFYSNELEHGVQHGIITFELKRKEADLNKDEPVLFDVSIDLAGNTYSTEKIKNEVMLKKVDQ